jgi:hypothetical protein
MDLPRLLLHLRVRLTALRRFDFVEHAHRWKSDCWDRLRRALGWGHGHHRLECTIAQACYADWHLDGLCTNGLSTGAANWWCKWLRTTARTDANPISQALTQYATSGSGSFAQGWRMCFFINLPLGAPVALVLFLFPVPERMKKPKAVEVLRDLPKKLDLIGFAILSAATVQLFLALEFGGNKFSWGSATVIGLFCGSAATFFLLGGWFWHKKENSLIPYSLLKKPTILCSSFVFASFMSRQLTTSYYLVSQSHKLYSQVLTNLELASLLPRCQRRFRHSERCLPPPSGHCPSHRRDRLRQTSQSHRLLRPLRNLWRCPHHYRLRTTLHAYSDDTERKLDRLPHPHGRGFRRRHTDASPRGPSYGRA